MADLDNDDAEDPVGSEGTGKDGDYEVGYGKPPKKHQFKKGNKMGGRKPGSKNLKTIVNEAASAKASAKMNGKTKKVPKGELAVHQIFTRAAAGDHKAGLKAIELQERYGPEDDPADFSSERLKPDRETLRNYLEWQDRLYPSEDDEVAIEDEEDWDDDYGDEGDNDDD